MYLLDRYVKIYRLTSVSGYKTSYSTLTTTIEATIQPLGDSKAQMATGSFGKLFKIYLDVNAPVQEGDRIVDYDGNVYKIEAGGIENRTDGFMADYMGVVCQKVNKEQR